MAIQVCKHAPFIGRAMPQASSLAPHDTGERASISLQMNELSEEDVWEAAAMEVRSSFEWASIYLSQANEKAAVPSSSAASSASISLPLAIPSSSCRSRPNQTKDEEELEVDRGHVTFRGEAVSVDGMRSIQRPCSNSWAAPHEIAARQHMALRREAVACSMVEGPGRTLKGRDLTNVRNAVWKTIGFSE